MSRELKPYPEYKDSGVEWIGEVPEKWETVKLKYVFKLVYRYPNYYGISYVSNGVMEIRGEMLKGKGKIDFKNLAPRYISEETSSRFPLTRLEVGDIVMSVRGTMGKIGLIDNLTENSNITANLLRLSPRKHVTFPKYLTYLMESNLFLEELKNYSNKTTIMTITVPNLLNIDIPVPNTDLQKEISDYLDQKTSEIDALIADKEKMITLLEEKRQAVITETVTKGLDPNVKMKDSGIEWIGEIPAHWEVKKIKHVSTFVSSGKTPRGGGEVYSSSGVIFLRSMNVHFDGLRLEDVVYIDAETDQEMKNTRIIPNDILLNITGASIGRTCMVPANFSAGNVNQHVCIIRPSQEISSFMLSKIMASKLIQDQINVSQNGSSREGLNFSQVKNLIIPIPDILEEQISNSNYIERKSKLINNSIKKINNQISKLKEYRESLIYEAVTGKIDLRNYKKVGETSESY